MEHQGAPSIQFTFERSSEIEVGWKGFLADLSEAATSFYVGQIPEAVGKVISSALKTAFDAKIKISTGEKIWRLAAYSLGWSLGQVLDNSIDHRHVKSIVKTYIESVEENSIVNVSPEFLKWPSQLDI